MPPPPPPPYHPPPPPPPPPLPESDSEEGSGGGPIGAPESESDSEDDPGFLTGVPEWLVTTCTIAAIFGCCFLGLGTAFWPVDEPSYSGKFLGGLQNLEWFICVGLLYVGANLCFWAVSVLAVAGAVASGHAWVVVAVLAALCFMACVCECLASR
jgi:hypothetical protein